MQFCPSCRLAGASPLPLDVGYYLFLVGSNIVLSTVVQQRVVILEFLKEKMSTRPSTLPSYGYTVVEEWSPNHRTLRGVPPPLFLTRNITLKIKLKAIKLPIYYNPDKAIPAFPGC